MNRVAAEDLVAHTAWMRRLARALTGRDADADDLVQEAYLAALRSPPDASRPARPWLAQVTRNAWRMARRGEARRAAREAELGGEAGEVPSPDQLLDRAIAQRALADLVVALAEPFRRTLLLRYFEELSTARIAELEGVAAATIRWRLAEALDRLRRAMDESAGPGRRWRKALLPAGISLPAPIQGALVMETKTKAAVAVLALAALGTGAAVVVSQAGGGRATPGEPAAGIGGPSRAGQAAIRRGARPDPAGRAPEPADARPLALIAARAELDPAALHGAIEGRVVNWGSGAGVGGAEVSLALPGGAATSVTAEADGRFHFTPTEAGRVTLVSITAAGFLPFAPEWGHSPIELWARPGVRVRDVVVYLTPAINYTGVVLSAAGQPVAGADVRLIDLPAGEQEIVSIRDRYRTDVRGEFTFHAPDFALLEARGAGHGPGRARLDGGAQTTHRLAIRLALPGNAGELGSAALTGIVVDASGEAVPGAMVRAEPVRKRAPPAPGEIDTDLLAAARTIAGDDGRFRLGGLDPVTYRIEAREGEHAPARAEVAVQAGGRASVRLTLTAGAVLSGAVVDSTGQPVPAFTVVAQAGAGLASHVIALRTVVDREGRFEIDRLEPGTYQLQATAHGHAPSARVAGRAALSPDRAPRVELQLPAGGTLSGVVRSQGGAPLASARISVEGGIGEGTSPVPFAASALSDERGEFRLRGLAPGRRSVFVAAYRHHPTIVSGLVVADGAALGPIEVSLTPLAEGEDPSIELAGIGAVLSVDGDTMLVEGVMPDGGAAAAGLVAGDRIVSVDGALVTALGFDGAIQAIRGPVGTTVRLGVRKADSQGTSELTVERRKIRA